jgi:lysophospholipase L1-like esterase
MRSIILRRILLVVISIGVCCVGVVGVEAFASYRVRQTAWNIRGYRGRVLGAKALNEVRVFAIGGSTTYGYTVGRDETYPAQLEALLNERLGSTPIVSVANLGHLSDSSVCYEATYRDYRYLEADIVIVYEGYNDVDFPARRTERDCYQQGSLIFRWTGFFPISPVFFREHWYKVRYGSITAGYEASRESELAARAAVAATQVPIPAYDNYERNVLNFVRSRLQEGKGVVFASQPYLGKPAHLDQQTRIRAALAPFMSHPRFRYRDFLYLFGGKWDAAWFNEQMWLNPRGNKVLAENMAAPVMELISTTTR